MRDLTALTPIATTVFEPREQGTIASFEIIGVMRRREGSEEFKDVTIVAPIHRPDGEYERKRLVATLQRHATTWRVTAVRPLP